MTIAHEDRADALALDAGDNVATTLRALAAGVQARVSTPTGVLTVTLQDAIPRCHKFALRDLAARDAVIKYGETIGEATAPIAAGSHVHVHNLVSRRA